MKRKSWKVQHIHRLRLMARKRVPTWAIAQRFKRTQNAVRQKAC